MKIAMYSRFNTMLSEMGIDKTLQYAKSQGFSGVEFMDANRKTEEAVISDLAAARELRRELDRYNLPMVCYSVGCNVWTDADIVQTMCRKVEIAKELGSPYLHHTLLPGMERSWKGDDFHEKIKAAVEKAEQIANYAEELNITCIYEEQGYYVNGVRDFGVFYNEMKKRCRNVGVCADLGNILFVNEKPEDFLREYIDDIRHVHVKDYLYKKTDIDPGMYWMKVKGNWWRRNTMVGHGVIDYPACMKILRDAHYQGAFSLELTHPEPYEEGVRQAMEYLERLQIN